MKPLLLALPFALLLGACDAKINTGGPPVVEKNTTIINPPAEKKVETNTTIVNPPAVTEKKVETKTTTETGR
jgi:hypothetical protein